MSPLDRSSPPEPGAIRPFDFPDVDRRPLANGLELRVARMTRLPMASAHLFMRAGEGALAEDRAGLAVLAGDALEGGTRRRSGTDLADALEAIGARLSVTTGWEGTTVSLSCLADRLEEGLSLLAEAVVEPGFPEEEVERTREQQLARIRQRAMDPSSLASDAAERRYYEPGVPYARPQIGTAASVGPLDRASLRGYADACWRPSGGGLVLVGDLDPDEMEALATRSFEGWEGPPALVDMFEVRPRTRQRRVWLVDRPGSVQSELRLGHVGTARDDPYYFPLRVLNTLFGGSFTSRLNLNLRETHGYTYGVRSRFSFRSKPGPFQVSTSVGTDVTAPAVQAIVDEAEALVLDGPTEAEVAAARDYIAGVFPLGLETVGQVGWQITNAVIHRLPEDYFDTYRDRIRAVGVEQAADAGRRHVRPGELQVVVVGDVDAVRGPLEELELGPLEVVEPTA
jgi:zinc protease